ncbi:MAG: hypothetical protein ACK5P6_04805 [Pseudobdellovibrionaceae bacterium]
MVQIQTANNQVKNFNFDVYQQSLLDLLLGRQTAEQILSRPSVENRLAIAEVALLEARGLQSRKLLVQELALLRERQQKKILKLLEEESLSHLFKHQLLGDFSRELFFLLRGQPLKLSDYFKFNSSERVQKQIELRSQEILLEKGLERVLAEFRGDTSSHRLELKYAVRKILSARMWSYLGMPLNLPGPKPVRVSEEILTAIAIEGWQAKGQLLEQSLRDQGLVRKNEIDFARGYYRGIVAAVFFFYLLPETYEEVSSQWDLEMAAQRRAEAEDFKRQIHADLDSTSQSFQALVEEIRREKYLMAIENLENRWGRPLTEEERKYVYSKVYSDSLPSQNLQN